MSTTATKEMVCSSFRGQVGGMLWRGGPRGSTGSVRRQRKQAQDWLAGLNNLGGHWAQGRALVGW